MSKKIHFCPENNFITLTLLKRHILKNRYLFKTGFLGPKSSEGSKVIPAHLVEFPSGSEHKSLLQIGKEMSKFFLFILLCFVSIHAIHLKKY